MSPRISNLKPESSILVSALKSTALNSMKNAFSRIQSTRFWPISLAVLLLLPAAPGHAADHNPPERMNYQGFLVDGAGVALGNTAPKNYDVIFRIWKGSSTQAATDLLWSEQQTVTADKGYFSVLLGEGASVAGESHGNISSVFSGAGASDRWVGITVKGLVPGMPPTDADILPRLRLLSSPYAFAARSAVSLVSPNGVELVTSGNGELTVNGTITANGSTLTDLDAANIASGTLNSDRVPNLDAGKLTTGKLDPDRVPNLDAGKLTTGTLDPDRVPNLDAGKLTTGMIADGRLPANVLRQNSAEPTFTGHVRVNNCLTLTRSGYGFEHNNGDGPAIGTFVDSRGGWLGTLSDHDLYFFVDKGSPRLTVTKSGNTQVAGSLGVAGTLGVGATARGRGQLEVRGGKSRAYTTYGLLNFEGASTGIPWPNPPLFPAGGADEKGSFYTSDVSIYADHGVLAQYYGAYSDKRIKVIRGVSDSAEDLSKLLQIEITDYTHVDTLAKGRGVHKKVIAQQVETVFPQAVSRSVDVVPDVFRMGDYEDGWIKIDTDLKQGDKVRLLSADDDEIHEVVEVAEGKFRSAFKTDEAKVFVYGREVNDFRNVDYHAIAMLNVSATQELARRLIEVEKREDRMKSMEAELTSLQRQVSAMDSLRADMVALRKLVESGAQARGEEKSTVLPTASNFSSVNR